MNGKIQNGNIPPARHELKYIVDMTIAYPDGNPLDLVAIVTGCVPPRQVRFHYKIFPIHQVSASFFWKSFSFSDLPFFFLLRCRWTRRGFRSGCTRGTGKRTGSWGGFTSRESGKKRRRRPGRWSRISSASSSSTSSSSPQRFFTSHSFSASSPKGKSESHNNLVNSGYGG